jgi:hypothetical protein
VLSGAGKVLATVTALLPSPSFGPELQAAKTAGDPDDRNLQSIHSSLLGGDPLQRTGPQLMQFRI